jgi:hypothetical protein
MAYSQTLNLVAGDTLPTLIFTLRDRNSAAPGRTLSEVDETSWAPINLTGASVRLKIRPVGSASPVTILLCTIISAANGQVATDFTSGGLTDAGQFEAEIEITFDTGVHTVYDLIKLKVRSDFD